MDTGTSLDATAAAHHSGPIEPAARTPPVPAAAAPRARITSFFSGSSPPTGTGTATPAVAQTPTTGTSTSEAQKAPAEAPSTSATGPETPAAAPESPATTTPTSGETMLPGESHEWLDNYGEGLFTERPKKKGKRTYGKLELKAPDFEIPEFGGGLHRKSNTVDDENAEEGFRIYAGHGAALYNVGPVVTATLYSKATFRNNTSGFQGGAVAANGDRGESIATAENANKITFAHETTFKDNGFDDTRPDNAGAGLGVYKNATVEFQDKVVFRRNEAANGGAITNGGGFIKFASAGLVSMIDNVGVESCPDIKNYDKEDFSHEDLFGDIDDPTGECGSSGDLCTWYEGQVTIGSADPIVGETANICEF